ncbi:MAG: hypothetical protein GC129_03965 [Proteobacteria bacterium]|nr:hypothetical protein [Pseudomonadota bacterium]
MPLPTLTIAAGSPAQLTFLPGAAPYAVDALVLSNRHEQATILALASAAPGQPIFIPTGVARACTKGYFLQGILRSPAGEETPLTVGPVADMHLSKPGVDYSTGTPQPASQRFHWALHGHDPAERLLGTLKAIAN